MKFSELKPGQAFRFTAAQNSTPYLMLGDGQGSFVPIGETHAGRVINSDRDMHDYEVEAGAARAYFEPPTIKDCPDVLSAVKAAVNESGEWSPIAAIKECRRLAGCDILQAKMYVENNCQDLMRARGR